VHGLGDHDPADVAQADRISELEARIEELEETVRMLRLTVDSVFDFNAGRGSDQWKRMIEAHELLFRSLVGDPGLEYDDDIDEDEVAAEVLAKLHDVSNNSDAGR